MELTETQKVAIEAELTKLGYDEISPLTSIYAAPARGYRRMGAKNGVPYGGEPWEDYAMLLRAVIGPEP